MHDMHSPVGCPAGAYEVDYAGIIDGDDPREHTNDYKEAALRSMTILNAAFVHVAQAKNTRLAIYQVASALGLNITQGLSDEDLAAKAGVSTKQAVSKGRVHFQRANKIKPHLNQKSESARKSFTAARNRNLNHE